LAAVEDASCVANVLRSSRQAFLPFAPSAHSESETLQWVQESLITSGGVTVACVGSQIVGVLAISQQSDCGWINQLYLAPESVGQGIGTQLLQRALRELQGPVRLYTFQANTRARSFYERSGFVAVQFSDGRFNQERCPDVLYELPARTQNVA
jgi:GNAT superfamily N-acetyltransferase